MHKKGLTHIIEKRFESFHKNWNGVHLIEKDPIHDWRVDYKKMRAVIRLLDEEEKKLEIPLSMKDVYTLAGEVRDRQMQFERMLQWFGSESLFPPAYTTLLQDEISTYAGQLQPLTENDVILKIGERKIISALPSHIPKKDIEDFIQQQLYEIRNILWLTYKKDDYLHSCRKHLKDAQYVIDAIGSSHFRADKIIGLPTPEQMQTAAQELGNFNDQCVCMTLLSSSYLNRLPGEEKIILSSIKTKTQKEKTRMKNRLIGSLEIIFRNLI